VIYQIRLPIEGVTRPITFTQPQAVAVIVAIVAVIALGLFLSRSRLGKAMRAVADNPELAQVSGISIRRVVRVTWIIAGGLACIAGVFLALDVTVKPDLAFHILLPVFAAAIVGGVGQVYGAIVAAYLIGFAEVLAVFNWAVLLRPFRDSLPDWLPANLAIVPTEYKVTVAFVILVLTLLLRPTGIFRGASS
jgi:branched-chain amino acid transport system permease protein